MIEKIIWLTHYQTYDDFNQTGIASYLTYPAEIIPHFTPLILAAIFIITLTATYFSQNRLNTGREDFFASFAVAGFFTATIATVMTLIEGLINLQTLLTTFAIAVIAVFLLMSSKNKE